MIHLNRNFHSLIFFLMFFILVQSSVGQPLKKDISWLNAFDIDGDGVNDKIGYDFSGGAHCCYTINITLSTDNKQIKFPFEMDGGYVGGLDNSQPNQFNIKDIDNDRLPEIIMKIQTYNNEKSTLPKKWQKKYGINSNYIIIEYADKRLFVRDNHNH